MSKLLLDSGIFSDYMHRRRGIFERVKQLALQGVRIGSYVPVVAEIAFGIEMSSSRDRNFQRLIGVLPTLTVWPFDQDSALTYSRIAVELRRSGRPMQVVDMMIGAISMNLGDCKVVTTDSDLEAISAEEPGDNQKLPFRRICGIRLTTIACDGACSHSPLIYGSIASITAVVL